MVTMLVICRVVIMSGKDYDAYECPVSRTLSIIGGRWKPIILYLIEHDINRFGELRRQMPRISKKVLTEQLRDLESYELIERLVVEESYPQIVIYKLTEKGKSLRVLIDKIFAWGVEHMLDETERSRISDRMLP